MRIRVFSQHVPPLSTLKKAVSASVVLSPKTGAEDATPMYRLIERIFGGS